MKIGHRDFRRRDQEKTVLGNGKAFFPEFRKLSCAFEHFAPDQKRNRNLCIWFSRRAILPGSGVLVEHVGRQGTLQSRPHSPENGKPASGKDGRPVEVEDAKTCPDFPVWQRFIGE